MTTAESLWVSFDLLAQPRVARPTANQHTTIPAADAALLVRDNRGGWAWVRWQRDDFAAVTLTLVNGDWSCPVSAVPPANWPLLIPVAVPDGRVPVLSPTAVIAPKPVRAGPALMCPTWCRLGAGHDDWGSTEHGLARVHRGGIEYRRGRRSVLVTITATEVVTSTAIRWTIADVGLARVMTPTSEEADFLSGLLPQIGAAVAAASEPAPLQVEVVNGTRVAMFAPQQRGGR